MLKKTITYNDFNGKERTEDFYFHLSEADIIELSVSEKDGLEDYLNEVVKTEDRKEVLRIFKDILRLSVGKKEKDGRKFIKSPAITEDLMMTNAYGVLLLEVLTTEGNAASNFIKGVIEQPKAPAVKAVE